jgi:hypothetical protein
LLSQFASQPNITDVNTIEGDYHNKMKQRLNDYNGLQLNFHPKPSNPNQLPDELRSTKGAVDRVSQQNFNDSFSRKLEERNNLVSNLKYGKNAPPGGANQLAHPSQIGPNGQMPHPSQLGPNGQMPHPSQLNSHPSQLNSHPSQLGSHSSQGSTGAHNALPLMEYPRNSNNPADLTRPNEIPRQQLQNPHPSQLQNQRQDYFAKIPTATQNPQQFYMNPNYQSQNYQVMQSQSQVPYTQTYQNPGFDQIQKQLQDLQKTVQQQNKVIRTLTLKKKPNSAK